MAHIQSSIEISAGVSRVWDVVSSLAQYERWNPFLVKGEGAFVPGERLQLTIKAGARTMTFKPTVVDVEPGRRVQWVGRLGVRGIFDGEHAFELESLGDGRTRFTQREQFRGILIPFMQSVLRDTASGFQAMNEALKARVEAAA